MASEAPQGNPFAQLLAVAREVSFIKGAELVRQGEASRGVVSATVVAHSNVDAWFVGRDDFRALVASREIAALEIQRAITKTLADKLRALNERFREYPAPEDRPADGSLPAADPLAGLPRSRRASFDWRAYLPVLPFFEGFDAGDMDEVVSAGKVLELPRGAWIFAAGLNADGCYIVLRGAVEIFTRNGDKQRRVAIAGPGELVGFVALLRGATHGGNARAREACCLLEIPRAAFVDIYNGASGATVSLHRAIHRSLMRSIARTNTQLTRLISHARLSAAASQAAELEAALHGQMWRAEG